MNGKKLTALALALCLGVSLTTAALAGESAAPWYAGAQNYVTDKGYMTGTNNGFEPSKTVTRAEVYQVLYNMEGAPSASGELSFNDIANKWYTASAEWAANTGLASGTGNGAYSGERAVTRAEIATMLYRYARYEGRDVTSSAGALAAFYDVGDADDWAVEALQWACSAGLIAGKDGGRLAPKDTATRAELATVLMRLDGMGVNQPVVSTPAPVEPTPTPLPEGTLVGKTANISQDGDVITDITLEALAAADCAVGDRLKVEIAGQDEALYILLVNDVEDVVQDGLAALADQEAGALRLAINGGDFATTYLLGLKHVDTGKYLMNTGKTIAVTLDEKAAAVPSEEEAPTPEETPASEATPAVEDNGPKG